MTNLRGMAKSGVCNMYFSGLHWIKAESPKIKYSKSSACMHGRVAQMAELAKVGDALLQGGSTANPHARDTFGLVNDPTLRCETHVPEEARSNIVQSVMNHVPKAHLFVAYTVDALGAEAHQCCKYISEVPLNFRD